MSQIQALADTAHYKGFYFLFTPLSLLDAQHSYCFNIVNSGSFSSSFAVGRSSGFTSRQRSSKSRRGGVRFSGICGGFGVDAIYAIDKKQ